MEPVVRCSNPFCRRPSWTRRDELGRIFRCGRCGWKLAREVLAPRDRVETTAAAVRPWESEVLPAGRSLGSARPARIGKYRVLGVLGRTGNEVVYRAVDTEADHLVALTGSRLSGDASARSRFLDEVGVLSRLRHPAILPVHEGVTELGSFYLATDLTSGRDLAEVLSAGPAEWDWAAEVIEVLAGALALAHRRGVAHRDLAPGRVWIEPGGGVRLSGFGAFRYETPDRPLDEAERSAAFAYLAPERVLDLPNADPLLVDQYALGVLFYEMLCGRPPFIGSSQVVLDAIRHDEPLPPRAFREGLPKGLERICSRAMARDPRGRYPDCAALAGDLARWRARRLRSREAAGRIRRAGRWVRRRPAEMAVSAALLVVLAIAATTVYASSRFATAVARGPTPAPTPSRPDPPHSSPR